MAAAEQMCSWAEKEAENATVEVPTKEETQMFITFAQGQNEDSVHYLFKETEIRLNVGNHDWS